MGGVQTVEGKLRQDGMFDGGKKTRTSEGQIYLPYVSAASAWKLAKLL